MSARIVRRQSPIHGNGVFAARDLPKGTTLIEYRGRRLTHAQANRIYGAEVDSGHTFLFTLNEKYLIDASVGGNVARWINHSCAPNCQAWVIEHESGDRRRDKIVIETRRAVRKGEELTYDYGIVLEERHTKRLREIWACRCGARRCTGTILKPKRARHAAG
ncbi:MAG TPA: SET domain-containing protein-lysine N-methyltransferase [Rudaea sp.]|jgi:SET domain-containing protein|nr:SET domain-containing protein-lysine N-methyltransferase [Rudaea sp.]